jgi:glycosyltransferase involved in cell wall biosynthesis
MNGEARVVGIELSPVNAPAISVVVPCRNEANTIESFIDQVLAQRGIDGGFEVLIADGMSDDGTMQIIRRRAAAEPRMRVLENPRASVPSGLNMMVRAARGTYVARMDVHTEYSPDYLAQCLECIGRVGANNVGGPARTRFRGWMQRANSIAYHSWFSVGGARFHDESYEGWVDTVPYGFWRREYLIELGLFDEELVRNQDDELNLRIIRSGGSVYQSPEIKSWYRPRARLKQLFLQYFQYGYWKVRVIQKHRAIASWRHIAPAGVLLAALALLVAGFFSPAAALSLAILILLYAGTSVVESLSTCLRSHDWLALPALPIVFAAYHFGYASGFLLGVLHFFVLGRRPARFAMRLSR